MKNYETRVYDYVDKKTGAHVVKAITEYAGKTVAAVAKCDPVDTFDLDLGTEVACKRLDIKIAQKREACMNTRAKHYREYLELLEAEKRRVIKALTRAEVVAADRRVEVNELEKELGDIISAIN